VLTFYPEFGAESIVDTEIIFCLNCSNSIKVWTFVCIVVHDHLSYAKKYIKLSILCRGGSRGSEREGGGGLCGLKSPHPLLHYWSFLGNMLKILILA